MSSRSRQRGGAEPVLEVGGDALEQALHGASARLRRADERVPGLHRRGEQRGQLVQDHIVGQRVRDAGDGVAARAERPPAPSLGLELRGGDVDRAGGGKAAPIGPSQPVHRAGRWAETRQQRLGLRMRRIQHIPHVEAVDVGVAEEPPQEALARGVPAHRPRDRRVVGFDVQVDRGVGHYRRRRTDAVNPSTAISPPSGSKPPAAASIRRPRW
jgi:hypothetical protein